MAEPTTTASYKTSTAPEETGYQEVTRTVVSLTSVEGQDAPTSTWNITIPNANLTPNTTAVLVTRTSPGDGEGPNQRQEIPVILFALYSVATPTEEVTSGQTSSSITSADVTSSGQSSTSANPTSSTECSDPIPCARLADGAVAGIAIATAIAGAALAGAILFFLFGGTRQRRDRRLNMASRRKPLGNGGPGDDARGPSGGVVGGALEKSTMASGLEHILPQALDDGSIKAAVSGFFKRIEDHVDSRFYPDVPAGGEKGPTETSSQLALLTAQPDLDVGVLLSDSHTRFQVLKALVCAECLAGIDFEGAPAPSLLPDIVAGFLSKMSPSLQDNHPTRLSLSRWRTSTRYLLGEQSSNRDRARRDQAANAIVEGLAVVLGRYAQPQYEDERRADLLRVCGKAEQLGLLLLAQPAEWMFDWEAGASKETSGRDGRRKAPPAGHAMVVFPALIKVTDDAARLIQPRRTVIPQVRTDTIR